MTRLSFDVIVPVPINEDLQSLEGGFEPIGEEDAFNVLKLPTGDLKVYDACPSAVRPAVDLKQGAANAVLEAARKGSIEELEWMEAEGVDIAAGGGEAVRAAAKEGHVEVLRWMENHGLYPNQGGVWAGRIAAERGHLEVVQFLWDYGLSQQPGSEGGVIRGASQGGQLPVLEWAKLIGISMLEGGHWALRLAAMAGHLPVLQFLATNGMPLATFHGTVLRGACKKGQLHVLDWVVSELGKKCVAKHGRHLIVAAAEEGNIKVLDWLVRHGVKAAAGCGGAIWVAVRGGHFQALRWLAQHGLHPRAGGENAVRAAVKGGSLQILSWLEELGLDVSTMGSHCGPHTAAEQGHVHILRWLLEKGVKLAEYGQPLVAGAARGGHTDILAWLKEIGVEPRAHGAAAVWEAAAGGQVGSLEWLLQQGVSPQDGGWEAVQSAAKGGHLEVLHWLAAHNMQISDYFGAALVGAATGGHIHVLTFLVNAGADLLRHQRELIEAAASKGHLHVLEWLHEHGVSPAEGGSTAVRRAATSGKLSTLQWLFQHGLKCELTQRVALWAAKEARQHDVHQWLLEVERREKHGAHADEIQPKWRKQARMFARMQTSSCDNLGAAAEAGTRSSKLKMKSMKSASGENMGETPSASKWRLSLKTLRSNSFDSETVAKSRRRGRLTMSQSLSGDSFLGIGTGTSSKVMRTFTSDKSGGMCDMSDPRILALSMMIKYPPDPREGMFDAIQRDASSGSLETLSFIKQQLGAEWSIRLIVQSGQLSMLQYLVTDDGLELKAQQDVAVRLAAENGHLAMLEWFEEVGLELGESVLEAACTSGMVMLLDTLQTFELPLGPEAQMCEEITPFIHKGRLNAMLLANCMLTPSAVAEHVLTMALQEEKVVDEQGRALARATMSGQMKAGCFLCEPDCDMLRATIAPAETSLFRGLVEDCENVPVTLSRVVIRNPTCPLILRALSSTERAEVYHNLTAEAIVEAAWHKVRYHYRMDLLGMVIGLAAVMHLTWWTKLPPGEDDFLPGGRLPFSFWPVAIRWLNETVFEVLQAKALLYDHPSWRMEYFSLTEAWDISCLLVMGALVGQLLLDPGSPWISPWISLVGFTRWWKVLYTLRAFEYFGPRILPILGVFKDVTPFFLVIFFWGGAFIHALYALSPESLDVVALECFKLVFIRGQFNQAYDVFGMWIKGRWAILQLFWWLTGAIMLTTALMNVFIAIMTKAFEQAEGRVHAEFVSMRACICLDHALCWEALSSYLMSVQSLFLRCCPPCLAARLQPWLPKQYRFSPDDEEVWVCHRIVVQESDAAQQRLALIRQRNGARHGTVTIDEAQGGTSARPSVHRQQSKHVVFGAASNSKAAPDESNGLKKLRKSLGPWGSSKGLGGSGDGLAGELNCTKDNKGGAACEGNRDSNRKLGSAAAWRSGATTT